MECNKDEAFRAKQIAEKKLQSKDFSGARKFALKAQQLHPATENISRLLSVCDVHCSAENKMFGTEKDWYGILQVEQTADEVLIKKQYRKFALLLHPDKNQFDGAEAAFKLIGEAQRVLLDKQRRAMHDAKRRMSYKPVIPHKAPQPRPQNNVPSNSISHNRASNFPPQGKMRQTLLVNGKEAFWTVCLHCSTCFQYYKEVMCRTIICQSCRKSFIAIDMNASSNGASEPVFPNPKAKNVKPTFDSGLQTGEKAEASKPKKTPNKLERKADEKSELCKTNDKRRKKHVESSESFASDSSLDSDEVEITSRSQHFDGDGDSHARRSTRNKRHVSCEDNAVDDELFATPSKKAKENGLTDEKANASKKAKENGSTDEKANASKKAKENGSIDEKANASNMPGSTFGEESRNTDCNMDDENVTSAGSVNESTEANNGLDSSLEESPEPTPEPTVFEYPDPEFCDFDKSREKHCFKAGEIWAAYDTVDAMPRYYAKIKKVYASGFKLQITWLETDPDDEFAREWTDLGLPMACGKFTRGNTETTEDNYMFSHVVSEFKSIGRSSLLLYPHVGEIWAIFKNWDAKWRFEPETERKFDYEFVEVLSDFDEIAGIRVAPLGKLEGFVSLFYRKSVNEMQISPSEMLRFSHMVPSYRMSGNERINVPKGAFELDPASTTSSLPN